VFALGIMPYITSSIILQLMTVVVPTLEKLQKEGELGRRKITQWTRYLTIILSVLQSFGIAQGLMAMQQGIVISPGFGFVMLTILSLTTGSAFIMWLGEQISERGVGNGMSLIIFTGIVVGLPNAVGAIYRNVFITHEWGAIKLILLLAMMVAVVAFIVLVERGERRIPVQYAKRVVGRRVMGGQSTHMPLKVNAGGVIPVIFASSILAFPQQLGMVAWVKNTTWLSNALKAIAHGEPLYYLLFVAGIIFFCFFYVSIIFNPNEAADNMRKYGGFIPGIRPGRNTADYMNNILTKITVVGGLSLSILCLIPDIMISGIHLQHLPLIGSWVDRVAPREILEGLNVNFYFGGTSLLIVVGVAMDTVNQIEAQLIMRHYEGFTPRSGRIRGRRSGV
jgi:preprotein translocase subunit SecY